MKENRSFLRLNGCLQFSVAQYRFMLTNFKILQCGIALFALNFFHRLAPTLCERF